MHQPKTKNQFVAVKYIARGYTYAPYSIEIILWYTDSKVPFEQKQELEQLIVDNLPQKDTENVMKTIAYFYINEGIEQRSSQVALNMLKQKCDYTLISSVTGLSYNEVITLNQPN